MRVRELRVSYHPLPGAPSFDARTRISAPRQAYPFFAPLAVEAVEVFQVLYLDTKHKPLGLHTIGRGTLDSTQAHARDILRAGLLTNAAAFITCHNHPSGDPRPSPDDLRIFEQINAAADLVGITPLDHMIVAENRYWSRMEAGL